MRTTGLEDSLAQEELRWLQLLHGQQTALNTVLDNMASTSRHHEHEDKQLDNMVAQVASFFESYSDSMTTIVLDRPFLENVGLILPLFLVILNCADIQVCRAAISLLGQLSVTEGMWNSCCAHAIGRFILNARYAARLRTGQMTQATLNDPLPNGRITKAICLAGGKDLDVTITFHPVDGGFGEGEASSAIIGGFCVHDGQDLERLSSVLVAGGFQGAVQTQPLDDCACHQDS